MAPVPRIFRPSPQIRQKSFWGISAHHTKIHSLPRAHLPSLTRGCPMEAMCTRIWWVLRECLVPAFQVDSVRSLGRSLFRVCGRFLDPPKTASVLVVYLQTHKNRVPPPQKKTHPERNTDTKKPQTRRFASIPAGHNDDAAEAEDLISAFQPRASDSAPRSP